MLRRTTLTGLTLAALAIGGGGLAPSPGAAATPGATSVQLRDCADSDAAETRSAAFYARMRSTRGSDHMRMRFTLLARFGDGKEKRVEIPALRAWRTSKPGVRVFGYTQTVTGLEAGGQYRAKVEFRWLDAQGNLLRKSSRVGKNACTMPGDLADLSPGLITAAPGPVAGTAVYLLTVRNTGKIAATGIPVELFVDGAATDLGNIATLAPGEEKQVRFTGPVCKKRLRAVVDPSDSIHETSELDNTAISQCP